MIPRLPCIQSLVDPRPYLVGFGHVPSALEYHYLKENEFIRVPTTLPDSCEFCGQRVNEAAPNSPAQRVVSPRWHDRQAFPSCLPLPVVYNSPTEVCSIVGFHPVYADLLEPQVLPRENVPWNIPCVPIAVIRRNILSLCLYSPRHLLIFPNRLW